MEKLSGISDIEVVDCTSTDVVPTMKDCRAIKSDVDGVVKYDYQPEGVTAAKTAVCYLPAGAWIQIKNVVKVYRYYTGTTDITTQAYKPDGTIVNGLKLGR